MKQSSFPRVAAKFARAGFTICPGDDKTEFALLKRCAEAAGAAEGQAPAEASA